MNGSDQTVIAILLIMLLVASLSFGILMVVLATHLRRKRLHGLSQPMSEPVVQADPSVLVPLLTDRPNRWLAIRSSNIAKVQVALGLDNPTPCSWHDGLCRIGGRQLFISPPLHGWILVIGQGLPDPAEDVDELYHFLMRLARELGTLQYFGVNRIFNHHAWVRIENGQIYRAYAWAGHTVWNEGEMTAQEKTLEMKCFEYGEGGSAFPFASREYHAINTEKVLQLAAKWSFDPMAIRFERSKAGYGIAGDFSDSCQD